MPLKNKHQSEINLSALLEGLLRADIEFILVGGLAAVIQVQVFLTVPFAFAFLLTNLSDTQ